MRLFAFGSASIALPVHLVALHVAPIWIGTILTAALIAGAAQMVFDQPANHRFGSTAVAVTASLAMAMGGLLTVTGVLGFIVLAAVFGLLNATAQEIGPFLPIEQVVLAAHDRGVDRMALYNAVGTGALAVGAIAGGALPFGAVFLLYALCGCARRRCMGSRAFRSPSNRRR